jgi:hypothetical protein
MLYCDLAIDGTPLWTGVPCLNCVLIDSYLYLGFIGHLAFADSQGTLDPDYTGIGPGGRFWLLYSQAGQDPLQVPLQAIPSQQFDIALGGQNCTISIYQQ